MGMRSRQTRREARTDAAVAAIMSTAPHPARAVTVAYTARPRVTRPVQLVVISAAARLPVAAMAEPTTKSGTSAAATSHGSSPPSVAWRTAGIVKTVIHHSAPAHACSAKYARPHPMRRTYTGRRRSDHACS